RPLPRPGAGAAANPQSDHSATNRLATRRRSRPDGARDGQAGGRPRGHTREGPRGATSRAPIALHLPPHPCTVLAVRVNVRFGSQADILGGSRDVRFTPKT